MLKSQKYKRGFTIMELVIAAGIFSIIALFATSSLLVAFRSSRRSNAAQAAMNNLNFMLENMSREIRFGSDYDCGSPGGATDCVSGAQSMNFQFEGKTIQYRKEPDRPYMVRVADGVTSQISGDANIDRLRFYVSGTDPSDGLQPRVTIVIVGKAGVVQTNDNQAEKGDPSNFIIQDTVTQRKEDI